MKSILKRFVRQSDATSIFLSIFLPALLLAFSLILSFPSQRTVFGETPLSQLPLLSPPGHFEDLSGKTEKNNANPVESISDPAKQGSCVAVVCPKEFRNALTSWIEYRQKQGYSFFIVTPVEMESFLDNAGKDIAIRIRNTLISINQKTPLSAVLLVGDAWPAQNRPEACTRIIPSPRVASKVIDRFSEENHIASDSWYTDFNGDCFPDVAVGRFPVHSDQELLALTRKIIHYEQEIPEGEWQRKVNFIAGVGDLGVVVDQVIDSTVRKIIAEMLPPEYVSTFTQANWKSPFCPAPMLFRDVVISRINEGALFWVYMGHGWYQGLDVLHTPDENYPIFEYNDAKYLNCSQAPPIMFFAACYTGTLDGWKESLAERMVLEPNGPIAAVAASRVSMPYGLAVFSTELLSTMFSPRYASQTDSKLLGSIILRAKQQMHPLKQSGEKNSGEKKKNGKEDIRDFLDQMGSFFDPTGNELDKQLLDHVHSINLIGDPLLRVRFPQTMEISAPETVPAAHVMEISGHYPPQETGQFKVKAELSLVRQKSGSRRPNRKEYSRSMKDLEEFQKIYMAANDLVLAQSETVASGGKFYIELKVPENCFGSYVLRVVLEKENRLLTGARIVHVRSFDPNAPRPSAHEFSGKLYHFEKDSKKTGEIQ